MSQRNSPHDFDTQVLIAGGGPVGMTLALELAAHGIRTIVVERNDTTTRHPKMDLTNGRSMELYRRLGFSSKLREVGVPPDHKLDITWVTKPGGPIVYTFSYPSPNEQREQTRRLNDGTRTLEPPVRISQNVLEPAIRQMLEANPLVELRFGWTFNDFVQDDHGVTSTIVKSCTGETTAIRSAYLAGCDGSSSVVRKLLGMAMEGKYHLRRRYMVHFKSANRDRVAPYGAVWHLQCPTGVLIAQDDKDTWTLHGPVEEHVAAEELDPRARVQEMFGQDFEDFEVEVANPFWYHMVIAESYGRGRVRLAGDSVHQVIPSGGYGMNTGVADAVDLGWKLSAVLNGWGGTQLLDSYEVERRPIAVQNRAMVYAHGEARFKILALFEQANKKGDYHANTAEGEGLRKEIAAGIAAIGNLENEAWGIEHGYRYTNSPVICHERCEPPFDVAHCHPTTWPGARLPHVYLKDGSPIYDHLGKEFTLLVFGGADAGDFSSAAKELGIPLTVSRIEEFNPLIERRLLLVRPDQHVAWRADIPPQNAKPILETVVGKARATRNEVTKATRTPETVGS